MPGNEGPDSSYGENWPDWFRALAFIAGNCSEVLLIDMN
jgi:hypothetical protein